MSAERLLVAGVALAASLACAAASQERQEILLTDIAQRAGTCAWRPMDYETKDGLRGTLLYAAWGLEPRQPVRIPLPARGRYRICLGLAGTRYPLAEENFDILVRLQRDPAPVRIDSPAPSSDAGWWWQPVEVEWKTADLADDTLVVENPRGYRSVLAWVRLVPVAEAEDRPPATKRFVVTNDAYKPADDLDELLAPIMRFADSPVRGVYYCVGEGPFTFAVPSKVAQPLSCPAGAHFESAYGKRCVQSYEKLHREHPRLLEELADFAHSVGLEFHVSFRTGCALEHVSFDAVANRADPGAAGTGIRRPACYCRLWDGTPVPRFSYAAKEVQDFFLKFYAEMLAPEKVDGINLIWIRALPAMLFEPAFRERFEAAYGEPLSRPDDPRVIALRKEIMTGFLRQVRGLAGKRRVSVVVPATGALCEEFGLDIARLAREGIVDEFDLGDSLQTAQHAENFGNIEFGYFRKALAGTKATYWPFLWNASIDRGVKSFAEGAAGLFLWDLGDKAWSGWQVMRRLDGADASRANAYARERAPATCVHPLKTLNGFDAAVYPWHVAY